MHTQGYNICGHEMEHVFEEKDLGVIVDSDLTFEEHIEYSQAIWVHGLLIYMALYATLRVKN